MFSDYQIECGVSGNSCFENEQPGVLNTRRYDYKYKPFQMYRIVKSFSLITLSPQTKLSHKAATTTFEETRKKTASGIRVGP